MIFRKNVANTFSFGHPKMSIGSIKRIGFGIKSNNEEDCLVEEVTESRPYGVNQWSAMVKKKYRML